MTGNRNPHSSIQSAPLFWSLKRANDHAPVRSLCLFVGHHKQACRAWPTVLSSKLAFPWICSSSRSTLSKRPRYDRPRRDQRSTRRAGARHIVAFLSSFVIINFSHVHPTKGRYNEDGTVNTDERAAKSGEGGGVKDVPSRTRNVYTPGYHRNIAYRIAIDTISNWLIGANVIHSSQWITWPLDMCAISTRMYQCALVALGMHRTRRSAVHPDTAHVGHAGVTRSLAHPLVPMRIPLPRVYNVICPRCNCLTRVALSNVRKISISSSMVIAALTCGRTVLFARRMRRN